MNAKKKKETEFFLQRNVFLLHLDTDNIFSFLSQQKWGKTSIKDYLPQYGIADEKIYNLQMFLCIGHVF